MKFAAIAALLWAIASPALAAPVTYNLAFTDEFGAAAGTGLLSYDPDITQDLWLDDTEGDICDPAAVAYGCTLGATWTPVALTVTLYDLTYGGQQVNFLEGHYQRPTRGTYGELMPGEWKQLDVQNSEGWAIDLSGGLSAALAWSLALPFSLPQFPNGVATGTMTATPAEIPLPPAALLFVAGVAGVGALRRHRAAGGGSPAAGRGSSAGLRAGDPT